MPSAQEILQDPNYVNANAATKKAIFDRHIASTPEYKNANPTTKTAIEQRFGLTVAPTTAPKTKTAPAKERTFFPRDLKQLATETGQGLASIADIALGAPGAILQTGETMGRRVVAEAQNLMGGRGETPEQSAQAAQQRFAAATAPVGTLTGAKGTPGYENEATRQLMNFIGTNIAKGSKWIAEKTGIPEVDVNNAIAVLGLGVPEAGAAVVRRAAPVVAPTVSRAANVMAEQVAPTVAAVRNRMTSRQPAAQFGGMGAADTAQATRRAAVAEGLREPVELTLGQTTREPGQLRFEIETAKKAPEAEGAPLAQRKLEQNQAVLRNFDLYSAATGAERAGDLRPVGRVVDTALQKYANERRGEIDAAYNLAREAGELEQPVGYQPILDYIEAEGPTAASKLAPILDAVKEQIKKNDPNETGQISLNALEQIRQFMGKYSEPGTPNAVHVRNMKRLMDTATEGVGGELYRNARALRTKYGREFENVAAVDRLLSAKGKYAGDRRVALEDVFDNVVLNSSFDEMRSVVRLLKKAGEEGQQAWKELQGQTIEHIRDVATRSVAKDAAGNPVVSPAQLDKTIRALDADGKLDYMFGKAGAQELRDLRDTVINISTAPAGTVNYSNSASMIEKALERLSTSMLGRIPGVGPGAAYLAERQRTKAVQKKVEEALYPNAMAPRSTPRNNMRKP